jgi:hypothetical protein
MVFAALAGALETRIALAWKAQHLASSLERVRELEHAI